MIEKKTQKGIQMTFQDLLNEILFSAGDFDTQEIAINAIVAIYDEATDSEKRAMFDYALGFFAEEMN